MNKILQLDNEIAIQIAGPTASGKSALAVKLAKSLGGEIINADSMQVYAVLDLLTARPTAEELETVPHHLYGHIAPGTEYSTGHWLKDVQKTLKDVKARGKLPIFVGGTGLYFKALNGGLSNIPTIPDNIRQKWRKALEEKGVSYLYDELEKRDPELAENLKPADKQRISRGLEVFDATGKSITHFQSKSGDALIKPNQAKKLILLPDRKILHDRIAQRFQKMVDLGALDEVRAFLELNVTDSHTSQKAIGVGQLSSYLKSEISLDEAIEKSVIATRQYAKRQSTWFRNQFDDSWHIISDNPESLFA